MKSNMEDIDKLIKETLNEEESKFYDELGEQGLFGMLGGLFSGKIKWAIIMMNMVSIMVFGILILCLVEFFNAESTHDLILWASGGFLSLAFISMIKIFVWLQMDKNALLREIKRLELQIYSLANKMD